MFLETVNHFARHATAKHETVAATSLRFFIAFIMGSAYIGLGIILIYSPPPTSKSAPLPV
jgi:formate/nitrite transporter FocA (FNT family)